MKLMRTYADGWNARLAGKPATDDPYRSWSEAFLDWADGWKDCDEHLKQKSTIQMNEPEVDWICECCGEEVLSVCSGCPCCGLERPRGQSDKLWGWSIPRRRFRSGAASQGKDPTSPTPVNMPFEHIPHCDCDDGRGPQWTNSEYIARTAACKLRNGPCRTLETARKG